MKRWLVAALCLWPSLAWATAGESEIGAGVAAGHGAELWSAGVEGRYLYDWTDFWAVGASVRDRRFLSDLPRGVTSIAADLRYALDALTFVPAVAAAAGAAVGSAGVSPFVRAEASLGYRPARSWGVTLHIGAEQESVQAWAPRWTAGLSFTWYRGAGIGLDL